MSIRFSSDHWAVILGGSSGMGFATARKLATHGMNVAVVHRDRRGSMPAIERAFDEIRATGVKFVAVNTDALSAEGREEALSALAQAMGETGKVRVLLHSVAAGNLRGLAGDNPLDDEDWARTIYAMGTSLATWTRALHEGGHFASDARVFGLTSEGNEVAWQGYAAVSAAKVALESVVRSIAVELGPHGIRANTIQAGVTETPALKRIPGHEEMIEGALRRNPLGRLTRPTDVADFICLLATDEAAWVNGALLRVDGGERVAG